MSQAIEMFYDLFSRSLSFLFNDLNILPGINVGYIFVSFTIFGLLLTSVLSLPHAIRHDDIVNYRAAKRSEKMYGKNRLV